MNKTSNQSPLNVFGAFARSGFFKKAPAREAAPTGVVRRRSHEAATAAQTARLCEVLGRGMSSSLRF